MEYGQLTLGGGASRTDGYVDMYDESVALFRDRRREQIEDPSFHVALDGAGQSLQFLVDGVREAEIQLAFDLVFHLQIATVKDTEIIAHTM